MESYWTTRFQFMDKQENWESTTEFNFNKDKCNMLHLRKKVYKYRMGPEWLSNISVEKGKGFGR